MTVYQIFNRICERRNRSRGRLVVTPYSRSLGNCAEEMYYVFLQARREGKRVRLLFPRPLFWKFRVEVANRALCDLESEFSESNGGSANAVAEWLLTILFFCLRQAYLRPRALFRAMVRARHRQVPQSRNNISYVIPSIGRATLWRPEGADRFDWQVVERMQWELQLASPVPVHLRAEHRRTAERARLRIGLPLDTWFVCVHVREAGYRGDWKAGAHRNSSIASYIEGIKAITEAGGFVVRLGDPTMTRLPRLDGVIDYAHSTAKSEVMDLYLLSECRFFVGVNSGPLDVAFLFQKPTVLTNLTNWSISFPRRRGDLAILKHVYSRSRGRYLSLEEILSEPFDCQCVREISDDYRMVDNSADEIRDVIQEYLRRREDAPYSNLQREFNRRRHDQIRDWLTRPGVFWSTDPFDDMVERYRFAPSAFAEGAVGRGFLAENWQVSRLNQASMAGVAVAGP